MTVLIVKNVLNVARLVNHCVVVTKNPHKLFLLMLLNVPFILIYLL